jgi:hypothetical protein
MQSASILADCMYEVPSADAWIPLGKAGVGPMQVQHLVLGPVLKWCLTGCQYNRATNSSEEKVIQRIIKTALLNSCNYTLGEWSDGLKFGEGPGTAVMLPVSTTAR